MLLALYPIEDILAYLSLVAENSMHKSTIRDLSHAASEAEKE